MYDEDRDARFDRIFVLHQEPIRRYCLRRLPMSDVNDAVADTFVVAWRRIDEAPNPEDALPWLYGVARNVVRNSTRSQRRLGRLRMKISGVRAEPEPSPENVVVRHTQDQEVLDALARLRASDQEILRLKVWEDLSNAEIAELLGIAANSVSVRLHRARNRLAAELQIPTTKPNKTSAPILSTEEPS